MAKYYQHIDPSDELFGKATKLLYVDDTDPDITVYNFSDGSKCSQTFIQPFGDADPAIGVKKMIEVQSPQAIWTMKKHESIMQQVTGEYGGESFDIPDPYFTDVHGNPQTKLSSSNESGVGVGNVRAGVRYDAYPPRRLPTPIQDVDHYCTSYIKYAVENGIELEKDVYTGFLTGQEYEPEVQSETDSYTAANAIATTPSEPVQKTQQEQSFNFNFGKQHVKPKKAAQADATDDELNPFAEVEKPAMKINADKIIASGKYGSVEMIYEGEIYTMPIEEFFRRGTMKQVEPVVVSADENIAVDEPETANNGSSTPEQALIDNMINMSHKEDCGIDMELILQLPPADVYKLIKTVYPEGMAYKFVHTIASRMPIEELKTSLANGLMAYYDSFSDTDEKRHDSENNSVQKTGNE